MSAAGDGLEFAYHRSLTPTLAVLLGLAIVETMVMHVLAVGLWGWPVAIVLGLLDLSLVIALVGLLRAIRRHPVTLDAETLTLRVGRLRTIAVPVASVTALRDRFTRDEVKGRGIANLALANWPNVLIEVDPPVVHRRRPVRAIAHKLDDPRGFAAALDRVKRGA